MRSMVVMVSIPIEGYHPMGVKMSSASSRSSEAPMKSSLNPQSNGGSMGGKSSRSR
jgi:hypothetical protein